MTMNILKVLSLGIAAGLALAAHADNTEAVLRESMKPKNQARMDRIEQNALQTACSNAADTVANDKQARQLREAAQASVRYPANGKYLGDWRRGQMIAADGTGLQWSDDPKAANGGNCYACHQLDKQEMAYGTVGPSLLNYGQRGQSEAMLKYTWAKIWNPNAYVLCSHMPRFGDAGILTEQQLKDVMALLMDPKSPVNAELVHE